MEEGKTTKQRTSLTAMARSWRPFSEDDEEEEDRGPIFSMSKSSMDVFMAAGPLLARDPAWTRLDLPRSSSTNTYVEKNSLTLQQLHVQLQHCGNARDTHQPLHSGSAQSVDSTPETVVYRGSTIRPWCLAQEAPYCSSSESLMSKQASPPTTPLPVLSPPLSPADPRLPSPLTLPSCTYQQGDTDLPIPSPHRVHTTSPLPPPPLASSSPEIPLNTENDFPQKHALSPSSSQYPSSSSRSTSSLEQRGAIERVSSEPGCLVDGSVEGVPNLTFNSEGVHSLVGNVESPMHVQMSTLSTSEPSAEVREPRGGNSNLELPGQNSPADSSPCRDWRLPLMCSLSDSHLGDCNSNLSVLEIATLMASPHRRNKVKLEEGTMTSKVKLVDAAVQTVSPPGSWWIITRHMSYISPSMGSHSFLGSPPGSKLNLRSSLGSNSNLVSPSSSMFQMESGGEDGGQEEDDPEWEVKSPPPIHRERRRSCLKVQSDERSQSRERDEMGRRGSMKQVKWDEDGKTWDIHGALLDPEELSIAIQRHMNLQSKTRVSPQPSKKKTQKKIVAAAASTSPVIVDRATPTVESNMRKETEGKKEASCTGRISGSLSRNSKTAGTELEKEDSEGEDDEVYGEEGRVRRKSSSHESEQRLKKCVMRSLKQGWCGSSSKVDN